jgi:hypothetical protein
MSDCQGPMKPLALVRKRKGFQILHICVSCGKLQPNKLATDTVQPDDLQPILKLIG